jgi:hypothetical protein
MDVISETLICSILNIMVDRIQELCDSKCDISSSEPCRIKLKFFFSCMLVSHKTGPIMNSDTNEAREVCLI